MRAASANISVERMTAGSVCRQIRALVVRRIAHLTVMPSDSQSKRLWHGAALVALGACLLALVAVFYMPPPRSDAGISCFAFANRSDRVLSNLDLDFLQIVPGAGGRSDEYSQSFSRHFTNVFPGCSVVVTSRTPYLRLMGLSASHPPKTIRLGSVVVDEWYHSSYGNGQRSEADIVATPSRSAGLCFTYPHEFARIGER